MRVPAASIAQVRAGKDGRSVLIEDDVCDIAKRLVEIDAGFRLRWSEGGGHFAVYHDDGERERLVTTTTELTPALVERIREIASPGYDFGAELDRLDRQGEAEREHAFREQIGEAGEHMAHALRKDIEAKNRIFVP